MVALLCINTFSVDQKQQVKWKSNSNLHESTGRKLEDWVLRNNYSDTFLFLTEETNYRDASIRRWGLTHRTTGTKKPGGLEENAEGVADSSSSLDLCGKSSETWRLQRQRRVGVVQIHKARLLRLEPTSPPSYFHEAATPSEGKEQRCGKFNSQPIHFQVSLGMAR